MCYALQVFEALRIYVCVQFVIRIPHMTRVIHDSGEGVQKEALDLVSSDVNFPKGHFPDYRIGPNNQIIDPEEAHEAVPLKEIVAKETAQLLEQHKRLSVRDLKEKFEKGLSGATKLSEEVFCLVCRYLLLSMYLIGNPNTKIKDVVISNYIVCPRHQLSDGNSTREPLLQMCNTPPPNTAQPSPSEGRARLHIAPHLRFRPRFA